MPQSAHRKPRAGGRRDRRLGEPAQCPTRSHQLDVHNRRSPRQNGSSISQVRSSIGPESKKSDRLGLDLRFLAVTPMRPMVDTEGGRAAVASYTKYLGISTEEFIRGMESPQTAQDVANAVLSFVTTPPDRASNVFVVSGKGVEPLK